ncbi:MAG TPA: endonuclease Q family protein [Candidatus Saccharimonadales bacterium]|nr:endonuclease Q family protein [Candidatus Saccharimonadales bacterium]
MDFVTDLHLHSRYSRAVSKDMTLPVMSEYARKKGFEILATGDWTHPLWLRELKAQLEETHEGLYQLKNKNPQDKPIYFLLSVEISSIYSQKGKGHRIHNLVLSPSFETSEKINYELLKRGCNLSSDGRPIIGLSSRDLLEMILNIDERAMLIPAHIWTPWFSLYGANSGFDSLEECFGDMSQYVYGIETGLSSDPEMNWQITDLKTRSILSFSDAHSPAKMGREATVFRLEAPSYGNVRKAIMSQSLESSLLKDRENRVLYTIEFYPEEGKYHYNGHRNCNVIETPDETRAKGVICPVCKRKLTVGVMQRVEDLANKEIQGTIKENNKGLRWITDPTGNHPPFVKIVPLNEIIAESFGMRVGAGKVKTMFDNLCAVFGSEMEVLLRSSIESIANASNQKIAEGVQKVRAGNIVISPGFDGEYGIVKIWRENESESSDNSTDTTAVKDQLGIDF